MSNLILNKVESIYSKSNTNLILASVTTDGGNDSPELVTSVDQLNRGYLYSPLYNEYKSFIDSGISLLLVGARSPYKFLDYPTLSVFTTSTQQPITHCHPLYDPLDEYYSNLTIDNLDLYLGFNELTSRTYGLDIVINSIPNAGDTLVIPFMQGILNSYLGVVFTFEGLGSTSIEKKYLSDLRYIDVKDKSTSEIAEELAIILVNYIPSNLGEIWIDNNSITIRSYRLLNFYDFDSAPTISYTNDFRFTQDVYYLRAKSYLVFTCYSKLLSESGKLVTLNVLASSESTVSIEVEFQDQIESYVGSFITSDSNYLSNFNSEYIQFKSINSGLLSIMSYKFDSFIPEIYSDEYVTRAYNQLYEYDSKFTALLIPESIKYNDLTYVKSLTDNLNSLLLVQVTSTNSYNTLSGYNYSNMFLFTGSLNNITALSMYLTSWSKSKLFSSSKGSSIEGYINENSLYPFIKDYQNKLKESPDFDKALNISFINSYLQTNLPTGQYTDELKSKLNLLITYLVSYLPRVTNIKVRKLVSSGNNVSIYLDTYYDNEILDLLMNFKLYN